MNWFDGRCHCGNIVVAFETASQASGLEVRACACSFCRKHGALAATDPAGRLRIAVADGECLERYVFGQRTAEFLVCGRCGVYVAAIQIEPEGLWATLNINVLDDAAAFTQTATRFDYDRETPADRKARRKSRWTPAELAVGGG